MGALEIRRYVMIVDVQARKRAEIRGGQRRGEGRQVRSLGVGEDAFLSAQLP